MDTKQALLRFRAEGFFSVRRRGEEGRGWKGGAASLRSYLPWWCRVIMNGRLLAWPSSHCPCRVFLLWPYQSALLWLIPYNLYLRVSVRLPRVFNTSFLWMILIGSISPRVFTSSEWYWSYTTKLEQWGTKIWYYHDVIRLQMKKSDNGKIQITRRVPQKARILLISVPAWVDDCAYESTKKTMNFPPLILSIMGIIGIFWLWAIPYRNYETV